MKAQRVQRRALAARKRVAVLCLGVAASVACSFKTDGLTFIPDDDFDAMHAGNAGRTSGGTSAGGKGSGGAHSGGTNTGGNSDAGDTGDAGQIEAGGSGGIVGTAGKGIGGKGNGGATSVAGSPGTAGSVSAAGSGMGGSVAVAGSGNGGSAGAPPVNTYPCKGQTPGSKVLSDFSMAGKLGDVWKDEKGTIFGLYAFPDPANGKPLMKFGGGDLTFYDNAQSTPEGAALRMLPCIDLTKAQTLIFTIKGSYGIFAPIISVRLITNEDFPVDPNTKEGLCVPQGKDPSQDCRPPHLDFPLPKDGAPLEFKFTDFKGGLPHDGADLDQVKAIEWVATYLNGNKVQNMSVIIDDVAVSY